MSSRSCQARFHRPPTSYRPATATRTPTTFWGRFTAAQVICSSAGAGTGAIVADRSLGELHHPGRVAHRGRPHRSAVLLPPHRHCLQLSRPSSHWGSTTVLIADVGRRRKLALAGHATPGDSRRAANPGTRRAGATRSRLANAVGSAAANTSLSLTVSTPGALGCNGHQRRDRAKQLHRDSLPRAAVVGFNLRAHFCFGGHRLSGRPKANTRLRIRTRRVAYYIRGFRIAPRVLLPLPFPAVSRKM